MQFVMYCRDKAGALQVRLDNRPAHLEFAKKFNDQIVTGGPTVDAGGNPTGSLIIFECADISGPQAFVDGDPYGQAGLFDQVTLTPWIKTLPFAE